MMLLESAVLAFMTSGFLQAQRAIGKGHDGGHRAGVQEGYKAGVVEGRDAGYEKGKMEGFAEGLLRALLLKQINQSLGHTAGLMKASMFASFQRMWKGLDWFTYSIALDRGDDRHRRGCKNRRYLTAFQCPMLTICLMTAC